MGVALGPEVRGLSAISRAADGVSARILLQKLTKDAFAAETIRHLLWRQVHPWPLTRITADDATDHMAVLLSRGIRHLHAPALPQAGGVSNCAPEEEDEAEFIKAAPASREPVARPQPLQEEGSLPRSADEAAIAAAMKMASRLGIPFCEGVRKGGSEEVAGTGLCLRRFQWRSARRWSGRCGRPMRGPL